MKFYLYLTGIVISIGMLVIFLPIRWKVDLYSSRVALGSRSDYESLDNMTKGGYVLVEKKINPRKAAKMLDDKSAYLGALEFSDGYKDALEAERIRKKKELFFRAFDPDPKRIYTPSEVYAKMRRAVLERSVDLILLDHVPENVYEKFKKEFRVSERPFPHPELPWKRWIFSIPVFLILSSLSPILSLLMLIVALLNYDISLSISSILSTLAVYKWSKKNPFYLFFSFMLLGLITNASMSDFFHMNGVLDFRGVKLSLILLPGLLFLKGLSDNEWALKNKKFKLVLGIIVIIIGYYTYRSGNYAHALPYEIRIRDFLDEAFWIRPRFKEVFGYTFLFFAFSRSKWSFLYEFLGSIALVSTFNTFCHIKTPIYTSIYRSLLAFGIALGFYMIIKGGMKVAENRTRADEITARRHNGKQREDGEDSKGFGEKGR